MALAGWYVLYRGGPGYSVRATDGFAVVRHDADDGDAVALEPAERTDEEAGGALLAPSARISGTPGCPSETSLAVNSTVPDGSTTRTGMGGAFC